MKPQRPKGLKFLIKYRKQIVYVKTLVYVFLWTIREGFKIKKQKNMDLSIFGWVGGSGKGQYP